MTMSVNKSRSSTSEQINRRVDAAMGRIPCDLVLKNARYLDVFSCEWRQGEVAVLDGIIVATDPGLKGRREVDVKGKWVVPGFIDAHVHLESSLMVPENFERAVLPRGTTTAICDPHELANVLGVHGIQYFLKQSERLRMDLRVMLSSCVPATHMETNGGGTIYARDLVPLRSHPNALGLAEMMNFPGVLHGDAHVLEKLEAFSDGRIDGHAPLVRGNALSAYIAAGVSSCHESSQKEEALEKLSKGMAVWIREGSVAKDLHELAPLLNLARSSSLGFCTDDRNPLDIAREGHIDYLIRSAIAQGVAPEVAYRAASWSVARHYGLVNAGAIAPGKTADLVILSDAATCTVEQVFRAGQDVSNLDGLTIERDPRAWGSVKARAPEMADLEGPSGRVHVIGVEPGKILTSRHVRGHDDPGVARFSVLERYGNGQPPANGYAQGFGENFRGAIAASVGHDSHNLTVVGSNSKDMRVALAALIQSGGGFCVVKDGQVQAKLDLPIGGLMSSEEPAKIVKGLEALRAASRGVGCALEEPFLQLAFLCLPVIPSLKLTDRGLVDVDQFKIIDVRAS